MLVKENATIPFELLISDFTGVVRTDITSVSVRVFKRVSGSEVDSLSSTAMTNAGSGKWYYSWSSTIVVGEYIVEHTVTDNASVVYKIYENLTVGYLQSDVQFLLDVEGGKWQIVANQMIFYKQDGITEVMRFNLFDSSGNPTMDAVAKRVRV